MWRKVAVVLALVMVAAACSGGVGEAPTLTTSAPPPSAVVPPTTAVPSATVVPSSTLSPATPVAAPPPTAPVTTTTITGAPPVQTTPPFDTWTVILASLSTDTHSREDAAVFRDELAPDGDGILLSDDYPSLRPGYWVVYDGVFEYSREARWRCRDIAAEGLECYGRYLGNSWDVAPTLANGQLVAWVGFEWELRLGALSAETGDVVRTISRTWSEGMYPGGEPSLSADGRMLYFDVFPEDSWFSCESTLGSIVRIDLTTGGWEEVAVGTSPVVSPDGRYLAYVEAPECLPDPAEPQFFVGYFGTIVVRDLATGSERRWRAGADVATSHRASVVGLAWSADSSSLFFSKDDLLIRRLALDTAVTRSLEDLSVLGVERPEGADRVRPIGDLPTGELVVHWARFSDRAPYESGIALVDLATRRLVPGSVSGVVGFTRVTLNDDRTATLVSTKTRLFSPDLGIELAVPGNWVLGAAW